MTKLKFIRRIISALDAAVIAVVVGVLSLCEWYVRRKYPDKEEKR